MELMKNSESADSRGGQFSRPQHKTGSRVFAGEREREKKKDDSNFLQSFMVPEEEDAF